jgi:hypothetical protein
VLAIELMFTMLPPSIPKCLTASLRARSRPRTLRSNSLWKCSSVMSPSGPELVDARVVDEDVPRAEGLPPLAAKSRVTSAGRATSACTAMARPPARVISATTRSASARLET